MRREILYVCLLSIWIFYLQYYAMNFNESWYYETYAKTCNENLNFIFISQI
jgi:hypothetical protein